MRIFFLLLFFFLVSCSSKDSIPDIQVKDLEGRNTRLTTFKGKPLVLYVWSKTCAGHAEDLKRLNRLLEEYKDYQIISYAIAMEPQDVKKSYEELKIVPNFKTLVDTSVEFNRYYPIVYLPSTYLFDEKGRFVKSFYGLPAGF